MFLPPCCNDLEKTEYYKEGNLQMTHIYSTILTSTDNVIMYFSETLTHTLSHPHI